MKIAIIDIGSNSVRLGVMADGKTLYKHIRTTRLGEGLAQTGMLSYPAIERTVQAMVEFTKQAQKEECSSLHAFATAAVRSASNRDVLLDAVYNACGVKIDVISGEEEASIGILGALKGKDGGIIDIGGASTEVSIQSQGKSLFSQSVNIGVVRILDEAGRKVPLIEAYIGTKLKEYRNVTPTALPMYAIGGTATTIASVRHGLKVYDPSIVDGTVLYRNELQDMALHILSLSVEDVKQISGMDVRRADVIGGGILLMVRVMELFGIEQITVSESDNLEGYALKNNLLGEQV